MEIVRTRTERAHHESVALKCLVNRRRLMNAPNDRLEIHDVECPWIEKPVPSNYIERMVVEDQLVDSVILLHVERKISLLIMRLELERPANVTLGVRRAFDDLPELVAIPFWSSNVPTTFENHELRLLSGEIDIPLVKNSAMDDEIVAFPERKISVHGLENALPLAHVDQLVGLGI